MIIEQLFSLHNPYLLRQPIQLIHYSVDFLIRFINFGFRSVLVELPVKKNTSLFGFFQRNYMSKKEEAKKEKIIEHKLETLNLILFHFIC